MPPFVRASMPTDPARPNPEFDVFLAHNSADKPFVKAIADELRKRGLTVWLDEDAIPPGQSFQDGIQDATQRVRSFAIFLGSYGVGKWQQMELKSAISQCVRRNIPVIPVLLPGVEQIPDTRTASTSKRATWKRSGCRFWTRRSAGTR